MQLSVYGSERAVGLGGLSVHCQASNFMQVFVAVPCTQMYMLHIFGDIQQALPGSISRMLKSIQTTDDVYVCLFCCTSQPWVHLDRNRWPETSIP